MTITVEMRAGPEKEQELYQVMEGLLPVIRKQKGCRVCKVSRHEERGGIFSLTMEWDEKASLERYLATVSGAALLGALDVLSESARLRIGDEEEEREGIEVLKKMRKKRQSLR